MSTHKINIPSNWTFASLEDIAYIEDHLRKPVNSSERQRRILDKEQNELYPYYGATGQVGFIDDFITDGDYILIGEDGAPFLEALKNKAYEIKGKGWVNNHAHVLKANKYFNQKFLLHYLNQFDYNGFVAGTTRLKLTKSSLKSIPVPVPPLSMQNNIVEKIDELFSVLDNSIINLLSAKKQIELFRKIIMKNAFDGTLTSEWHKQNSPTSAKDILVQIILERESKYQTELENWTKDKKNSAPKKHPESTINFSEFSLPEIPSTWQWIRLGEIEDLISSGSTPTGGKNAYVEKGIPFLRSQNIHSNKLLLDNVVFINENTNERMKRTMLRPYDVLLNITGASIGRCAFIPENIIGNVNQHVCIIRSFTQKVNHKFLSLYLNSPVAQKLIAVINSGATREALNLDQIRNFPFPLVSIEEQIQIINTIESNLSIIDNLNKTIDEKLSNLDFLRLSILKKAVSGNLVPQNGKKENALDLLKIIKKEKQVYLKEQLEIRKNLPKKVMKKKLIDALAEKFGEHNFTFEEVRKEIHIPYDELKNGFFDLLEKEKRLTSTFSTTKEIITFKISK